MHRQASSTRTGQERASQILNDIDENELKKPNLHVSLPVVGDAGELIRKLICEAERRGGRRKTSALSGRGLGSSVSDLETEISGGDGETLRNNRRRLY